MSEGPAPVRRHSRGYFFTSHTGHDSGASGQKMESAGGGASAVEDGISGGW
jgi:hypothetical protein